MFGDENPSPDSKEGLFDRLPGTMTDRGYQTRSGRMIKPMAQYIPSMGSGKKYEEQVMLQVENKKETQRNPGSSSRKKKILFMNSIMP